MPQNTTIYQPSLQTDLKLRNRADSVATPCKGDVIDPFKTDRKPLPDVLQRAVMHRCSDVAPALFLDAIESLGALQELPGFTGPILLAYCEDSSYDAAIDNLYRAFAPKEPEIIGLHLGACNTLHLHDDMLGYVKCIASLINQTIANVAADCVILAHSSMEGAAKLIDSSCPTYVLQTAADAAVAVRK